MKCVRNRQHEQRFQSGFSCWHKNSKTCSFKAIISLVLVHVFCYAFRSPVWDLSWFGVWHFRVKIIYIWGSQPKHPRVHCIPNCRRILHAMYIYILCNINYIIYYYINYSNTLIILNHCYCLSRSILLSGVPCFVTHTAFVP